MRCRRGDVVLVTFVFSNEAATKVDARARAGDS